MHHNLIIKDGDTTKVAKEVLVDGIQFVDEKPRAGSTNPVTSDGVANAVTDILDDHDTAAQDEELTKPTAEAANYTVGNYFEQDGEIWKCTAKTDNGNGTWTVEAEKVNGVVPTLNELVNSIAGVGIEVFEVSYSTDTSDYVYPTYTEIANAVSAGKTPVILQYIHNSPLRRCFVFRWLSGGYIYFDNGSQYVEISNENAVKTEYLNDKNLAADYNPTATYSVGDYCMYNNNLFVCTTDIAVAEAWDSSHWQRTSVTNIIGDVESLLAAL